jgi:signal peptidase
MATLTPVYAPGPGATRRLFRFVAHLLAGAAFGLGLGLLLLALLATRFLGFSVIAVNSDSMAPAISRGDAIVVKPVAPADIEPGDVILFRSGGDAIPTVHRVVGVHEFEARITSRSTGLTTVSTSYRFATRGDGNPLPDAVSVPAEDVLGEVWFTVPTAGAAFGVPARLILLGAAGAFATTWLALEVHRHRKDRAPASTG